MESLEKVLTTFAEIARIPIIIYYDIVSRVKSLS